MSQPAESLFHVPEKLLAPDNPPKLPPKLIKEIMELKRKHDKTEETDEVGGVQPRRKKQLETLDREQMQTGEETLNPIQTSTSGHQDSHQAIEATEKPSAHCRISGNMQDSNELQVPEVASDDVISPPSFEQEEEL